VLAFAALELDRRRQLRRPFDELVVEERRADFETVGHAGAIDLGQDVAGQVRLVVQVLHERERIFERLVAQVAVEHLARAIALQLALERGVEQQIAHLFGGMGHPMQIRIDRAARQALERGLTAQHARRPIQFRIPAPERSEYVASQPCRQAAAEALFHREQLVAAIADEILVAAVAGQRDSHMPARELTDAVRGNGRAVRIGLVVDVDELIQ
jgi:hypothetical protein